MQYECHITCRQVDAEAAAAVAQAKHWKTSEIARDPVLGQATYYYLTSHSDDYMIMFRRMKEAVTALKEVDAWVLREKIELIMYDSKVVV